VKGCEFITLISGAATSPITWPLAARAQQPWRLAVLILHYSQTTVRVKRASRRSSIHSRSWAGVMAATSGWSIAGAGDAERANAAAAELVRSAPDVFVVATAPGLAELHRLTSTIPIVFTQVGDPLEAGSIASLARPGGNITGFHGFEAAMGAKFGSGCEPH
jgi:putative ABC transport system substrate-binding protein